MCVLTSTKGVDCLSNRSCESQYLTTTERKPLAQTISFSSNVEGGEGAIVLTGYLDC